MSDKVTEEDASRLFRTMDSQGLAVASVSDGTVIMITAAKLKELLAVAEGKGSVTIFIKRPQPQDSFSQ